MVLHLLVALTSVNPDGQAVAESFMRDVIGKPFKATGIEEVRWYRGSWIQTIRGQSDSVEVTDGKVTQYQGELLNSPKIDRTRTLDRQSVLAIAQRIAKSMNVDSSMGFEANLASYSWYVNALMPSTQNPLPTAGTMMIIRADTGVVTAIHTRPSRPPLHPDYWPGAYQPFNDPESLRSLAATAYFQSIQLPRMFAGGKEDEVIESYEIWPMLTTEPEFVTMVPSLAMGISRELTAKNGKFSEGSRQAFENGWEYPFYKVGVMEEPFARGWTGKLRLQDGSTMHNSVLIDAVTGTVFAYDRWPSTMIGGGAPSGPPVPRTTIGDKLVGTLNGKKVSLTKISDTAEVTEGIQPLLLDHRVLILRNTKNPNVFVLAGTDKRYRVDE